MYTAIRYSLLAAALALGGQSPLLAQGETSELEFVGSARQADSLLLTPTSQTGDMSFVIDDSVTGAMVMITSSSKTLTVSLIDPNLVETFVGGTGPGITGSITYPEDADTNPAIEGKDYVFRLESAPQGTWTVHVVETATLTEDLPVVANIWMEANVQGFVVGGGEDYLPSVPVRLGIFMMDDTSYLSGYTVSSLVYRLMDNTFTPVAVTFADDGVSPDFVANDGLYTGEVSLSEAGDYDFRATVAGLTTGGQPYERELFAQFRVILPSATLVPSTVSDFPVDADADSRIDKVVVQNDVSVVDPGDYLMQVDLQAAGGATVSRSVQVTLGSGTATVGVDFEPAALQSLGEDGPYAIKKIRLDLLTPTNPAIQDALYDVGSTSAYQLSDLERDPIVIASFTEVAEDCGLDGDLDRLLIDVVVDVINGGSYQYSTTLTDIRGNEILFFNGTRSFVVGPNLLHFEIDGAYIAARGGDGPYSLSSALLLGPVDSLALAEFGHTQTYLLSDWQAPPTTVPVFADFEGFSTGPIAGQQGWSQTVGADPNAAIVSSAAPKDSLQSLEMHIDPFLGNGTTWGVFSPLSPASDVEMTAEFDMRLDGSGGPTYEAVLQSPSNGFVVAWLRFAPTGDVLAYQSSAGGFVSTGYDWLTNIGLGQYFHVLFRINTLAPVSQRVQIKIDGITIYTGGTLGSTFAQQFVFLTDNTGPDQPLFVDNVQITNRNMRRDCNGNGHVDACDIDSGIDTDCNANGIPDHCDITSGFSRDCNHNNLPDECDLAAGTSLDCNGNGVPDECDQPDCDQDGIPDDCEIDCDNNGAPDECEIIIPDCNVNGIPDICEPDCDGDTIPDDCEDDCNENGIPDDCDLMAGTSVDCNGNGVPDECDLASGTSKDCNNNSIPDECDIAAGTSQDANGNGIPDECECLASNYCLSSANSAGPGAFISFTGSLSVSVNDTILTATGLPPGQFGIFFYGPNPAQVTFGNGFRCVGGQLFRLLPPTQSDALGNNSRFLDMDNLPHNGDIHVGDTRYFQHWYRDPMGGGSAFNLTDGLQITFCH